MKKALSTTVILSTVFILLVVGVQFEVIKANPYIYVGEVPPKNSTIPPVISIFSPNNQTILNVNSFNVTFNVSEPTGPTVAYPYITDIYYNTDWVQTNFSIVDYTKEYGHLNYSGAFRVMYMPEGNHNLTIIVTYRGSYIPSNDLGAPLSRNSFSINGYSVINFTIDTIPPRIVGLSIRNSTYSMTDMPLDFFVTETSQLKYSLDNQANITILGNTTLTGLTDGLHNLVVYAHDTAGNIGKSDTVLFTIDTTTPSLTPTISPSTSPTETPTPSISLSDSPTQTPTLSPSPTADNTQENFTQILTIIGIVIVAVSMGLLVYFKKVKK